MSQLIEDLKWRYATKKFNPHKIISQQEFEILKDVLTLVPTSNGLQPFKFLIIEDKEIREKLKAKSWNQPQITDASHLIVMCSYIDINDEHIDSYINLNSSEREIETERLQGFSSHLKRTVSAQSVEEKASSNEKQVYIALGHLLHAAAQMRIDSSPMEGFEPDGYDEILGLTAQNLKATVACALGYRADDDAYQHQKKVRKSHEDLFKVV